MESDALMSMEQAREILQKFAEESSTEPWALYIAVASGAVVVISLVFLRLAKDAIAKKEAEGVNPEVLNFRVNQHAVDRLRDPSLPPIGKKPADQIERERWLQFEMKKWIEVPRLITRNRQENALEESDGSIREYCHSRGRGHDGALADQEFADLGYEICGLDSVNLPKFQGLRVNSYLHRVERIWSSFPTCELAVRRMNASRDQLARFLKTLRELHRLGLRVETIPVWLLLQREDGEFFIPHIPVVRQEPFPCDLQVKMSSLDDKFPAHLFGPKDSLGDHRAFQFQLASFIWRLLAGDWPYDKEPLLFVRNETPSRIPHDFGESLTLVLRRMTSLEAGERYDDLGSALDELASALAAQQ